jgi:hypothetical protein
MFLYKFLTEENNKVVFIDAKKSQIKFNGEYEGDILCQNCDNVIIGRLDDYFAKFIHGEFPQVIVPRFEKLDNRDVVVREDDPYYDYSKYKLFLLSLLWRSSISSRPLFGQIKLPAEIEEDLRLRILSNNPGEPEEYPCFLHLPPVLTDEFGRTGFHTAYMPTMSPIYMEKGELKMCEFIIEGVHYYFIVARPANMKVEPAVDRNKLTLAFATKEDQEKVIQQIIEFMKGHSKYKK